MSLIVLFHNMYIIIKTIQGPDTIISLCILLRNILLVLIGHFNGYLWEHLNYNLNKKLFLILALSRYFMIFNFSGFLIGYIKEGMRKNGRYVFFLSWTLLILHKVGKKWKNSGIVHKIVIESGCTNVQLPTTKQG